MRSPPSFLLALALALPTAGCAALSSSSSGANLSYSTNAKENYDKGVASLKSEDWVDAQRYFQFTRAKFGFSKWATLAELGLADADFGRGQYLEAVDSYKAFIKNHPTHEMVQNGYAAFRICESFFKEIPTDWFLVPPSYEKDQGPVRDATRELKAFVEEYADSVYAPQARKMLDDAQRRLAQYELYVAGFYLDRGKPYAAIGRLEGLLRDYPHSLIEADVLLLLGRTYVKMDKLDDAKKTFERLMAAHPNDYQAKQAKLYVDHIAELASARAAAPKSK